MKAHSTDARRIKQGLAKQRDLLIVRPVTQDVGGTAPSVSPAGAATLIDPRVTRNSASAQPLSQGLSQTALADRLRCHQSFVARMSQVSGVVMCPNWWS